MELPKPDWDLWANVEKAMGWELVLLSLNVAPEALNDSKFEDAIKARKDYQARCLAVERSGRFGPTSWRIGAHPLSFKCDVNEFLAWSQSLRKPWSWPKFMVSEVELPNKPLESMQPTSDQTESKTSARGNEEPSGKSRSLMIKMIGALAKGGYNVDPHAKRKEVGRLKRVLELQGVNVDEKTLRKFLTEASELLDTPQT